MHKIMATANFRTYKEEGKRTHYRSKGVALKPMIVLASGPPTPMRLIPCRNAMLKLTQAVKEMVEAAGVEPASENVTGQETTCLFAFMPLALPKDVRGRRSERTRNGCR